MELEFFCKPGTDLEWFTYWRQYCIDWLQKLGIKEDEMRARDHSPEELCFYSKGTTDIEFLFPFGWGELWGIADRTDYDLTQHQTVSGEDMSYFDDEAKEKYIPYVIEPSLGADRVTLAFLCSAYDEEELEGGDVRTVLHFHPALAPVKIGVLPLSKKLNEGAEKVFAELSKTYNCEFDDRGNIGKRYRRQDEIGTPFCITYDFDSEEDNAVTVRDRDTMEHTQLQVREDGLFRLIVCVQDLVLTTSCQMERFIFQERHRVVQIIRQAALPQQQLQRNRVRQAAKIRLRLSLIQDTVDQILVRQGMEWQRRT